MRQLRPVLLTEASCCLLVLCLCLLLSWETAWIRAHIPEMKDDSQAEVLMREFAEQYENIWKDLKYFPIPEDKAEKETAVSYENSWMFERTYGGSYGHEGTDLMPPENRSDYYPVVSVSDGTVEKIGWLEKGGWRIGVRSLHDVYFYYAHLSSYAEEFQPGDPVKAGQLLGYMGDTGYGIREGTSGQFPVHLHFGIYVRTGELPDLAVNPYWFLKYLEHTKLPYGRE